MYVLPFTIAVYLENQDWYSSVADAASKGVCILLSPAGVLVLSISEDENTQKTKLLHSLLSQDTRRQTFWTHEGQSTQHLRFHTFCQQLRHNNIYTI